MRTPVTSRTERHRRTNECVDDNEVTTIRGNRAVVDQKLDKLLNPLKSQLFLPDLNEKN